jgi:glycine/D-amino acid oxidase-like deaminating enzyme
MTGYNVGIIGAGVHGASAAFHLAGLGSDPIVFDARGIATGPTGRSSAVCRGYYTNAFLARCAHDSIEMIRNFAELTGGRDASFRETGFLWIHPADDRSRVHETVAMLTAVGTRVEIIPVDALPGRFPEIEVAGVDLAVWEPGAGHADPVGTTRGLLERAVELGAEARLATEVTELRPLPGGGAEVVTRDGSRVPCRRLLIAAGPWTSRVACHLGIDLPLTVERHYIAQFGWGRAPRMTYGTADMALGYYMRPEGRDLFIVGELRAAQRADPDSFDEHITFDEIASLAGATSHRIPGLVGAESRGGWASLYDMSPDWQPVIGEVGPGVFVNAGTSGHGFKLAPALGKHVADLVLERPVDPELAQFHPRRFPDDHELQAGYGAAHIIG